uniref:Serpentine receptor class gamma n=1 Tax=Heterorhabditis bacteriophora TaxID=37862 RepID=A0A1I7XC56_HETBA
MWCWDMTTTRFIAIGFWCREMLSALGSPSYILTPVQFIMTYSRHAQFYVATVLSINRMTAVVYPAKYSKIWGSHLFPILLSIFLLPLLSSWYLLPTQTLLAHYPMGGLTITYIKMIDNPWNSVTYMTMVVGSFCGVFIFISTIVTYYKLNNINIRECNRTMKTEHSLLVVGLVSSTTTFCLAVVELPFYILCNYFMDAYLFFVATCIKQLLIDIMFVFCPWSMFLVCTGIRKAILDMLRPVPHIPQKQFAGRISTVSNIL